MFLCVISILMAKKKTLQDIFQEKMLLLLLLFKNWIAQFCVKCTIFQTTNNSSKEKQSQNKHLNRNITMRLKQTKTNK